MRGDNLPVRAIPAVWERRVYGLPHRVRVLPAPGYAAAVESARAMSGRRVLILGLDPDAVPGIDAAAVPAELECG